MTQFFNLSLTEILKELGWSKKCCFSTLVQCLSRVHCWLNFKVILSSLVRQKFYYYIQFCYSSPRIHPNSHFDTTTSKGKLHITIFTIGEFVASIKKYKLNSNFLTGLKQFEQCKYLKREAPELLDVKFNIMIDNFSWASLTYFQI